MSFSVDAEKRYASLTRNDGLPDLPKMREVALTCLSALQLDAHASVAQRPELSPCKRAVEGSTPSGGSKND